MKLYLDTSVISALFDDRNPERKALTEAFSAEIEQHDAYISEVVLAEIERTPAPELREKMESVLPRFTVLPLVDDAARLAGDHIRYGAIPETHREDALHIAIAVVNDMDCLLSWNFKHLVRRRTRDIVRMVNTLNDLSQIEIMAPAEF